MSYLAFKYKLKPTKDQAVNIKNWAWEILTKNTAGTAGIQACGVTSDGADDISSASYVAVKQEKFCAIGTEARTL